MDIKEISRQEYTARINRVMDYAGRNLDKQIDLAAMAEIASFSPYHFHRIFSCVVGETPNNFILRIRLEKAAVMLLTDYKATVNDISFRCGFINASSFSRAFNQIGQAYEKLFKWAAPRGLVTAATKTVTVYHDDPAITTIDKVSQDASMVVEGNVKVEGEIGRSIVPAGKYAVGHFEIKETEFEQAWNTMCSWLTESGYQPTNTPTYEYYHNDYNEHPAHKFIVDICIPVKPL